MRFTASVQIESVCASTKADEQGAAVNSESCRSVSQWDVREPAFCSHIIAFNPSWRSKEEIDNSSVFFSIQPRLRHGCESGREQEARQQTDKKRANTETFHKLFLIKNFTRTFTMAEV
jgi:hypothetical protein